MKALLLSVAVLTACLAIGAVGAAEGAKPSPPAFNKHFEGTVGGDPASSIAFDWVREAGSTRTSVRNMTVTVNPPPTGPNGGPCQGSLTRSYAGKTKVVDGFFVHGNGGHYYDDFSFSGTLKRSTASGKLHVSHIVTDGVELYTECDTGMVQWTASRAP